MKKSKMRYFFFVFAFFLFISPVKAEENYIVVIETVNVRPEPSTLKDRLGLGSVGNAYNLKQKDIVADIGQNGACDAGWYEIDYNGQTGYVCSDYANAFTKEVETPTEPTTTCEIEMSKAGFPSSYWSGLCSLKEKHPTWTFKPINTNLEWSSVIEKQSACGKSLIQTSNSEYLDSTCKAYDGTFKAASQKAVAFYMDPRNFLTEKYIFQFEYLKYDQDLSNEYPNATTKLYGSAAFYTYHKEKGTDLASIVTTAGKEADVSPIFLASRMYQELGTSSKLINLYGGEFIKTKPIGEDNPEEYDPKEYYGFYNFYNIGVSSSCNNKYGSTYCGLSYAKNNGWNSVYNAIKGGASFLSKSYINVGQYTTYLQKYNVDPTNKSKLHTHQYMTNVAAPSSESTITYNSYNKLGLLESAFVFYIPVYTNMNTTINNSSNGGSGETSPSAPSTTDPNTIITSAGYKVSSDIVTGIKIGASITDVKGSLESISGDNSVEITNSSGTKVTSGKIGTGFKIKITNQKGTTTYTVVIKGDTSGDGIVNALDLLQVQKQILGTLTLKDYYKIAADTSGDDKINALDLLQVQKQILGTYTINQ